MKPDYKNWIPKGMLFSLIAGTVLSLALLLVFGVFGLGVSGKLRVVLGVVFGIAFVVCAKYSEWCVYAYRSFSYDGERKLSKQIIEGTSACRKSLFSPLSKFSERYKSSENLGFQWRRTPFLGFPRTLFLSVAENLPLY